MKKFSFLFALLFSVQMFGQDSINIVSPVETVFCIDDNVVLVAETVGDADSIFWEPDNITQGATGNSFNFDITTDVSITASILINDTLYQDTIDLSINPVTPPSFEPITEAICEGSSFQFSEDTPIDGYTYEWSPSTYLDDPNSLNAIASIEDDVDYTLLVTNELGCELEFDLSLEFFPFSLEFVFPGLTQNDTILLCKGDSAQVSLNLSNPDADVLWIPQDSTIEVFPNNSVNLKPSVTTDYYVFYEDGNCSLLDTITVRVDSLPDGIDTFNVIPFRDVYCEGEIVTLVGQEYVRTRYPHIEFLWSPADAGIQTPIDNFNVGVGLQDTTEFIRITTNGACIDTAMMTIDVIPINVPLTTPDTILCPDKVFITMIDHPDADRMEDITWDPEDGISGPGCPECISPIITVQEGYTEYTFEAMLDGCPVTATLTTDNPPPIPITVLDELTCPNDPVILQVLDPLVFDDPLEWSRGNCVDDDCLMNEVTTENGTGVTVEGRIDGCIAIGSASVNIYPDYVGTISITPDPADGIGQGEMVTASLASQPDLPPNTVYNWLVNGEAIASTSSSITFSANDEDVVVMVSYVDPNGCEREATLSFETIPPSFDVPNVFAPGDCETNPVDCEFRVFAKGNYTLEKFVIYNRWGQKMWEAEDILDTWDGTYRSGQLAPAEVYVYLIQFIAPDGDKDERKGDVTLLR